MLEDSDAVAGSKSFQSSYKNYTEENLREAIKSVVNLGMRTVEASFHYGIPLTTLTRKIRSCKQSVLHQGSSPAFYTDPSW